MSAGNGIYIGRWNGKDSGYEYRVVETQNIEDYDFTRSVADMPDEIIRMNWVSHFGQSKIFRTLDDARTEANRLYAEIMNSDFPVLEYGISELTFNEKFPSITTKQAEAVLDKYWRVKEKKWEKERQEEDKFYEDQRNKGYMTPNQVRETLTKNVTDHFNTWMEGQTVPLVKDESGAEVCGVYRWDLQRYLESLLRGKPTYWD